MAFTLIVQTQKAEIIHEITVMEGFPMNLQSTLFLIILIYVSNYLIFNYPFKLVLCPFY